MENKKLNLAWLRGERVEENGHGPLETAFAGDRQQINLNMFFFQR